MDKPTPDWDMVTLKWAGVFIDGSPCTGAIRLEYSGKVMLDDDEITPINVFPRRITVPLTTMNIVIDGQPRSVGYAEVKVPATNDPDIDGGGGTYELTEELTGGGGRTNMHIVVDYDTPDGVVWLNRILPTNPDPGDVLSVVYYAEFASVKERVTVLEEGGIPGGGGGGASTWAELTGKPTEFTPAPHTQTASTISDATATGRSVLTAANAAAARTAIGAGTSNLTIGTTSTTAKAGNYAPTVNDIPGLSVTLDSKANAAAMATALDGKSSVGHTHGFGDVVGLQGALDAAGGTPSWAVITGKPATFPPTIGTSATTAKAGNWTPAISDVSGLQAALDSSGGGGASFPSVIYVTTTTEAALRSAIALAISTRGGGGVVTKRIQLGAGTWNIASPDLIASPTGGSSDQIFGLEIVGMGPRVTTLNFTHNGTSTSDARQNNMITAAMRLRYFKMQDMTVTSNNVNNCMLWAWSVTTIDTNSIYPAYGSGQNQRLQFVNIEWQGSWKRIVGIDGDVNANNNSEWLFRDCCTTNSSAFSDAFLHCGGITGSFTQQAQFLNFRIDNCNMTLASGSVWKFDRGGAITVVGGSWSAASSSGAITWFDLTRSTDITAMSLEVIGVRFEPKSASHVIIDCKWGDGHVVFQGCSDVASLQYPKGSAQSGFNLHRYTGVNNRIPMVSYQDCTLVGVHKVTGYNGGPGRMDYIRTKLYHWDVAYATTSGGTNGFMQWASGARPRGSFRDMDNALADQVTT